MLKLGGRSHPLQEPEEFKWEQDSGQKPGSQRLEYVAVWPPGPNTLLTAPRAGAEQVSDLITTPTPAGAAASKPPLPVLSKARKELQRCAVSRTCSSDLSL